MLPNTTVYSTFCFRVYMLLFLDSRDLALRAMHVVMSLLIILHSCSDSLEVRMTPARVWCILDKGNSTFSIHVIRNSIFESIIHALVRVRLSLICFCFRCCQNRFSPSSISSTFCSLSLLLIVIDIISFTLSHSLCGSSIYWVTILHVLSLSLLLLSLIVQSSTVHCLCVKGVLVKTYDCMLVLLLTLMRVLTRAISSMISRNWSCIAST